MGICYPGTTDWSCRFTSEELATMRADPVQSTLLSRSEAFGWYLLAAMTAYRIGVCPVTVRPCARQCVPRGGMVTAPVGSGSYAGLRSVQIGRMSPYVSGGLWYNACGCMSDSCSCQELSEVLLPGPVGSIEQVVVDGVVLPRSAYRVDNGYRLVRLDGDVWPVCQDMALPADEGFSVTYYRGARPNMMVNAAAGVLAAEFYSACSGGDCRLPGNVTSVITQGSTYEMEPTDYPDGKTGLPEVDAVIMIYNPYGLKSAPRVSSPDAYSTRQTTWM